MKQCPVPGCHTKIQNNRFLCDPHWTSLSGQLRNRAYNLFEDWDEHKITPKQFRQRLRMIVKQIPPRPPHA